MNPSGLKSVSLVIVGHGSTVNPDSSAPTRIQARRLQERGIFREVHCCFWKEKPFLGNILEDVAGDEIYVVPNFISEGYFTRVVLPREMKLDGAVTARGRRVIHYCRPVGTHPRMTELLLQRARAAAPDAPPREISLIIVGHGTPRHDNSATAAREQADAIRRTGEYAEVLPAYMEEPPRIADWHLASAMPNVIVVPFFIADGLHRDQDIPELLGLPAVRDSQNTRFEIRGRRLFYGGALGSDPALADIIVDQVRAFQSPVS